MFWITSPPPPRRPGLGSYSSSDAVERGILSGGAVICLGGARAPRARGQAALFLAAVRRLRARGLELGCATFRHVRLALRGSPGGIYPLCGAGFCGLAAGAQFCISSR